MYEKSQTYRPESDRIEAYLDVPAFKDGGKWRPNPQKPQDMIFIGELNTVKRAYLSLRRGGYWVIAKYDENGHAVIIRHETEHAPGSGHTNPHDHIYSWDTPNEHPQKVETINYPDGAPELKTHLREKNYYMQNIPYCFDAYQFHTISEFKTSIRYGAEVVIEWCGKEYGIWSENGIIRNYTLRRTK